MILALTLLGVIFHSKPSPGDLILEEHTIQLELIRGSEARRMLGSVLPSLHVLSDEGGVTVSGTRQDCQQALALLEQVDIRYHPVTRFVPLIHTAAEDVAEAVDAVLSPFTKPEAFQVVADTRTNRVFLMGDARMMAMAEQMIELLDRS